MRPIHQLQTHLLTQVLAAFVLAGGSCAVHAAKGHEHGVAHLDVVVDGSRLALQLSTPLDNLVGFERAPRSDAERKALDASYSRLRDAGLWQPDPAAECKAIQVELQTPAFDKPKAGDHSDVELTVAFNCARPAALASLRTSLFTLFPRLSKAEVQMATPRGQAKATLRKATPQLNLQR